MKKIVTFLTILTLSFGITGCSSSKTLAREDAQTYALKEVDGKVSRYEEYLDEETPYYLFHITKDNKEYEVKIHSETGKVISNNLKKTTTDTD